jgi:hypothetical protein
MTPARLDYPNRALSDESEIVPGAGMAGQCTIRLCTRPLTLATTEREPKRYPVNAGKFSIPPRLRCVYGYAPQRGSGRPRAYRIERLARSTLLQAGRLGADAANHSLAAS